MESTSGQSRFKRPRLSSESSRASSNEEPILPPLAPSDEGKHTLVLDMDGTILMESNKKLPNSIPDFILEQRLTGIRTFVMQRCDLNSFLASAEQFFEIVIFTESSKKRADVILDMIENRRCIRHRLYRDSCNEIDGRLVKDMSRLGRDLRKVIIVDDCPFAYSLQRFNAIPMPYFNGRDSDSDEDFAVMYSFLTKLIKEKDVRIALKTEFKRQLSERSKAHNNPNLHPTIIYPSNSEPLLPPMHPSDEGKYTLVLDMDGTLLQQSSHKLPEEIGSEYFTIGSKWYVYKRPGVELFMAEMAKLFEIVIFTASTKERAETVTNKLENKSCIRFFLFQDSCIEIYSKRIKDADSLTTMYGRRIKDLSLLGRDLKKVIIIDDNPLAYELQLSNAIPIKEFDGGKTDRELRNLIPFLTKLREEEDVRPILQRKFDYDIFAKLADGRHRK